MDCKQVCKQDYRSRVLHGMERAMAVLRESEDIPDHLLAHLSPLGWEHVNLTGTTSGEFRIACRKTPTD